MAERAEMTVAQCSLMSCMWARFLVGFAQQYSQPTLISFGEGCVHVKAEPITCTLGRMTRVLYVPLR